ncbi:MAG: helix-turn-helix transcriptional regulator [Desulfobacteraceae bacterium]|nr:helix-turn-helix transcriptional regulator [Desulfobacteraceae bacterium]
MFKYNLKEMIAQKEFRDKKRLTLTEIAQKIKVSRATISRIANSKGEYHPKNEYIEKLCTYFNCTPNDLITIVSDTPEKEKGMG